MIAVHSAPSFRELTTLRLGGRALAEIVFTETEEAEEAARRCAELGAPPFALGGGSNLLARDGEIPVVLVRARCLDKVERLSSADTEIEDKGALVRAGAGVPLKRLTARFAAWGLSGLEGLTGIPGTVGGAVAMNAGSFGTETARLLHSLLVWIPETGVTTLYPGDWNVAYRQFELTSENIYFFVLAATFHLTKSQSDVIRNSMSLNFFQKKSTQPLAAWSAGCAFKNPPTGPAAGKLLEEAGVKGKRLGGTAFSTVHANFLVNEGSGSATAAFELLAEARETVFRRSGINLQTEIRIVR